MAFDEEVIVPFPVARELVPMGTEFKSTWLAGSLGVLKAHGAFERYLENLPAKYHDPILRSIAGTWLPAVGRRRPLPSHRCAQDQRAGTHEWGKEMTKRLQKTIFSVGFHAAREVGVTPLTMLKTFPVQFAREWIWRGTAVFRIGSEGRPGRDRRLPISSIAHCRTGLRGVLGGMCELVCTKAYVSEIRELCTDSTLGYRVAWA